MSLTRFPLMTGCTSCISKAKKGPSTGDGGPYGPQPSRPGSVTGGGARGCGGTYVRGVFPGGGGGGGGGGGARGGGATGAEAPSGMGTGAPRIGGGPEAEGT